MDSFISTSGWFKEKDNRRPEEQDLIELRKRNKQPEMEADIIKQTALIKCASHSSKDSSTDLYPISK
ncbi:hypothetical protein ACFFHM_04400 [Halalkalibacter kiskunsagensis]|uniref:Uncharacterized protein n=1 Tax=Halalkalibacter kiskunsagensis TaxID=1548599 RepID=A0ABV6K909_9BACI